MPRGVIDIVPLPSGKASATQLGALEQSANSKFRLENGFYFMLTSLLMPTTSQAARASVDTINQC
jgi:hypothetical protein